MSLLKIPLVLSSAIAVQVAVTPPHSASDKELYHNGRTLIRLSSYFRKMRPSQTIAGLYWAGAVAEITAIIARHIDSSKIPSVLRTASEALSTLTDVPITPSFFGGFIRWLCYRTLGRYFTFLLSVRQDHRLITTGPYAIVRHPSYTGMMMLCLGIIILHGSRNSWLRASGVSARIPGVLPVIAGASIFCTAVNFALFSRMKREDRMMHSAFGEEWEAWARNVKYRIIPGVY
ncbi:uncharacterized protein F5891DRAFT_1066739 [Suillus fuscotomentosus]|uniref:Protein-S-isoprenylcysteine O-methyltransferase n=1 Tax=Suillus fuscotomentosus TaxID=1912939 RepID=A0AAD4HDC5_9AGAM|nr:uncharacterized protein F5891DRAFT_1066739 [Suillus fuscotomentosus]KAG1893460.1 hypothetical protein F5891DRAFT_1066739 [Suillus fuscotomentosus]